MAPDVGDWPLPEPCWPALKAFAWHQQLWGHWHGWGQWPNECHWVRQHWHELRDVPRLDTLPPWPKPGWAREQQSLARAYQEHLAVQAALGRNVIDATMAANRLSEFWCAAETATDPRHSWASRRRALGVMCGIYPASLLSLGCWPPAVPLWFLETHP